jgi:uncharacterized RmlC-like cupin family protein
MGDNQTQTCVHIPAATRQAVTGRQGVTYFDGISTQSAGSQGICLHLLTLPPRARPVPHVHFGHETAIYLISGTVDTYYGPDLSEHLVLRAGDFLYIPAGTPHLPINPSDTEPAVALVARTDPNEQESVVLMPELDGAVAA